MKLSRKIFWPKAVLVPLLIVGTAGAFAPTNFFAPYDPNLQLPYLRKPLVRLGANIEGGQTSSLGYNWDGTKTNILQINDAAQNITAQVTASNPDAYVFGYGRPNPATVNDNATGGFALTGSFEDIDMQLYAQYRLPVDILSGYLKLCTYLPVRAINVKVTNYTDLTPATGQSALQALLQTTYLKSFDLFKTAIKTVGTLSNPDLNFDNWTNTGIGDTVVMLEWFRKFKQGKANIKNVDLYFKAGVSIPSGDKKNADKVFSMPMGNDGAWGIPAGVGLALELPHTVKLGGDFELLALFDQKNVMRMKSTLTDTEFVLLNKGIATVDHGLSWKFNVFAQAFHITEGLSLKAAYEYFKHDRDSLTTNTNGFSSAIINSANSLKEWNTQNIILQANYDWLHSSIKSQVSVFAKLPVSGKKVISPYTFGGQLALNF